MIVYGRQAVYEALRGPRTIRRVWATQRQAGADWQHAADVRVADAAELERICGSPEHQGVCADVSEFEYVPAERLLAQPDPLIVALDQVQDPGNLGAICRTAEAAGATGVVIPERRAAPVTAAVCRASAGAVEHLPVARVRNLADFLADARSAGCWCYGASPQAAVPYDVPDFRGGVVLVLGSEGPGLRPRVAGACDELLAIPHRGRVGSLNVAAAAAVLLFAVVRGREKSLQAGLHSVRPPLDSTS